ncbi:MAG: imidazole glycerol phosphate synthase subunit HisF [Bacteroidetes bacterium]|nr:MAG: imidazole glycerol phosphate synthase subunit HisF [Bacteroidota bacterium]
MFRPRVIPVLLLKGQGLVKTVKFKAPTYIGDPMNAVKIFNDMEADELIFLDIMATSENRIPSFDLIQRIGDEAFMPFAVGGGIKSVEEVKRLIRAGAEKIVINSAAFNKQELVRGAADAAGSQSVIVAMDVRRNLFGKQIVYVESGKKSTGIAPEKYAENMQRSGAGEIMLNSIERDGMMAGYDIDLIKRVSQAVDIPVVACGGAGSTQHFAEVVKTGSASAVAAGSMFVYHGSRKGVLINYPDKKELETIFN